MEKTKSLLQELYEKQARERTGRPIPNARFRECRDEMRDNEVLIKILGIALVFISFAFGASMLIVMKF